VVQFGDRIQDGLRVAGGDTAGPFPVIRVVSEVISPARQHHRPGGVGQQNPDRQGFGLAVPDPDRVQWFLDDAVQGFPGEPGEVDRDMLAVEGALDERPDTDRGGDGGPGVAGVG
jgi:hypothetical protein